MVIFKNANSQSGSWIFIPVLSGELINYPPSRRVKYNFIVFVWDRPCFFYLWESIY